MDRQSKKPTGRPLIPRDELACVWMTAGVLGFRLCDRALDCANCPLDRALRNLPEPEPKAAAEAPARQAAGFELPDDLFYHPGHTWVRVRPGGEFEVGVDDLARRLLSPILALDLPRRGTPVAEGLAAFTVHTEVGTFEVAAPFEGVVTRTNPDLAHDPAILSREPFCGGWVLRAIPENPARALAHLREGEAAERWAESEAALVRDLLDVAMADRESGAVGATMTDGGNLTATPLRGVAPEAARRILARVLRTPER